MNLTMNKSELIEAVSANLGAGSTKKEAEAAVSAVLDAISTGIKKDGKVQVIGFGTFDVRTRPARDGRNPKTGEKLKIKASKNVGFKASSNLKAAL